jgi:outer membrane receptor for ferrienterochelin and colicins
LTKQFSISAAYQYLETGDKDQLAQIKNGTVYTRDANGLSRKLNVSEYVGLPNNSAHKAQLKFNYSNQNGLFGNIRALYRSKWAVNNTNGNEVFDDGDSFAKGYIALHLSIGKDYVNGIGFQFGCDNMLNYIDALNLPNLPGRTFFATLKIQKSKKI